MISGEGIRCLCLDLLFFFKQKTAYEMRISDWSSDVCSSDLRVRDAPVEDDRGLDPRVDRAEAGIDLGNHAAGDRRVGLQRVDARSVEVGEQRPRLVEQDRKSTRLNSSH